MPGSGLVKRQAEAEGLDRIFVEAGFEWREAGCSMCLAMNPDKVPPGGRCASTSNRNFAGRQGPGARTHLLSPAMAAAAAVTGRLSDVRELVAAASPGEPDRVQILHLRRILNNLDRLDKLLLGMAAPLAQTIAIPANMRPPLSDLGRRPDVPTLG